MNRCRNLIAAAILSLPLTACASAAPDFPHPPPTHTAADCSPIIHGDIRTGWDYGGGIWAHNGHIAGYALQEDSPAYSTLNCQPFAWVAARAA